MTVARGREYFAYHPHRGTKRAGQRVVLPGCPLNPDGTPNEVWWAAYRAAAASPLPKLRAGTFAALAHAWAGTTAMHGASHVQPSPEFAELAENTKSAYRTALARILSAWGELQVRALEPRHVLELRDAMREVPQAANKVLAVLSSIISWSIPRGWRTDNPCDHVKLFNSGVPWAAWSWEAIAAWREFAVPELWRAAALILYTGQRPGDALSMTWSDVDAGVIHVVQEKTGARVWIPLHRDLRQVLTGIERPSVRILQANADVR